MTDADRVLCALATVATLPTPAYVYDLAALERSVAAMQSLLPPGARLFYSVKANPQPELLRSLLRAGIGAEAVSDGELALCRACGAPPDRVIAGGVAKSADELRSLAQGAFAAIVIDSVEQWTRLRALHGGDEVRLLLRINPGVAMGGLDMAGDSQFGMTVGQAANVARDCATRPGFTYLGLHAYFGSQRLTVEPIVRTVELVAKAVETLSAEGLRPGVVNIGLGCGVAYLDKDHELPLAELRSRLAEAWSRPAWDGVDVWSEAGRFLVAGCGYFVARVLERKCREETTFVFLDGGLNAHNPGLGVGGLLRSNPRFLFPGAGDELTETIEIVGNLCTSADRIGRRVAAPRLEPGDLVAIANAGAYCQTTALWGFNSQRPFHEAVVSADGSLRLVTAQHGLGGA